MLLDFVHGTDGDGGKWNVEYWIRCGFNGYIQWTVFPFVVEVHDEIAGTETPKCESKYPKDPEF